MYNNNQPPFAIGQTVVCVKSTSRIKKDIHYTVAGNIYCSVCNLWFTTVIELGTTGGSFKCNICYTTLSTGIGYIGAPSEHFAPINPYTNSVTKELAEKALDTGDKADMPIKEIQKVNN